MDEEKVKELKSYTRPRLWSMYVVSALFFAGLAAVLSILFSGNGETAHYLVALLFLAMGIGFTWGGISGQKNYNKRMASLEESGEMYRVLADFAASQPLVDGKIRLGQSYVFGKNQGQVVPYGDIRQVYQYIHKRNFVEDNRQLRFVNQQGKTLTLCDLKLKGKSDEDMLRIVTVIKSKNPGVQIGYK